jgi:hypothetical protein
MVALSTRILATVVTNPEQKKKMVAKWSEPLPPLHPQINSTDGPPLNPQVQKANLSPHVTPCILQPRRLNILLSIHQK